MYIALIWLYALMWAVFPLLGWGGYGPEPYGMACSVDWAGYQNSLNDSTFIMALAVLCTILPCLVIISSYSGIAWKLHKAYQTIQNSDHLPNYGSVERKVTMVSVVRCVLPCCMLGHDLNDGQNLKANVLHAYAALHYITLS